MPGVNDAEPEAGIWFPGVDAPGWKPVPAAGPWEFRPLDKSEERVPRFGRLASRALVAIVSVTLAAPASFGYAHLNLSLRLPTGTNFILGAHTGELAPSLTSGPASVSPEMLLADQEEQGPEDPTAAAQAGPRPVARRARSSCRGLVRGRTRPRGRSRRSRRERSSPSPGDPGSEDPDPDVPGARAVHAGRHDLTHARPSAHSATPQSHLIRHWHRPIWRFATGSHTQWGSPCSDI
jgi:hypothetical protein